MAHDGLKPAKQPLTATELIALYHNESRHSNSLVYELRRTSLDDLLALVYGEYAVEPFTEDVPEPLGALAYDEMERRQAAVFALNAELRRRG